MLAMACARFLKIGAQMKTEAKQKGRKSPNFIPHEIAIERVKKSFERSKADTSKKPIEFVEVK
tara:strand:- start:93245 stop:93433 length:189 start_codon:yes stop_codon:yes gene_type:complete